MEEIVELYVLKIYQATHRLDHMVCGHSLSGDGSDTSSWIKFDFFTKQIMPIDMPTSPTANGGDPASPGKDPQARRYSSRGLADLTSLTLPSETSLVHPVVFGKRQGILATVESVSALPRLFPLIVKKMAVSRGGLINAIHVILTGKSDDPNDDALSASLASYLTTQVDLLNEYGVRRVTFLTVQPGYDDSRSASSSPRRSGMRRSMSFNSTVAPTEGGAISIYTYRQRANNFATEDSLFRHIEAPHAYHLDLPRLSNFTVTLESIPTVSGNVFLYRAVPLTNPKGPVRFFARLVSYVAESSSSDAESLFVEALDFLGIVMSREEATLGRGSVGSTANHVYLNIVAPDSVVQLDW